MSHIIYVTLFVILTALVIAIISIISDKKNRKMKEMEHEDMIRISVKNSAPHIAEFKPISDPRFADAWADSFAQSCYFWFLEYVMPLFETNDVESSVFLTDTKFFKDLLHKVTYSGSLQVKIKVQFVEMDPATLQSVYKAGTLLVGKSFLGMMLKDNNTINVYFTCR